MLGCLCLPEDTGEVRAEFPRSPRLSPGFGKAEVEKLRPFTVHSAAGSAKPQLLPVLG